MYGLRKINNNYPGGNRGDWIIVGHPEFKFGRSKPLPYMTASLGRPGKKPTTFAGRGPAPLSQERLSQMAQRRPKTAPALRRSPSDPAERLLTLVDIVRARQHEQQQQEQSRALASRFRQSAGSDDAFTKLFTPKSNGCDDAEKQSEEKIEQTITTSQSKASNRPQSALPGKMQHGDALQEQTSDLPVKRSARPTSAPVGSRCQRTPAQQRLHSERLHGNAALPRTAAQARKALEELRASLGLDDSTA